MSDPGPVLNLAVSAAVGFLIGFEREWRDLAAEKERFAGARTFALAGLAGGLAATADPSLMLAAAGLLALGALTAIAFAAQTRLDPTAGATTEAAFLATYLLGALAAHGEPALAAGAGVAVAILLALKPQVEAMARSLSSKEISAAPRFLAIAIIVLPLLPDRAMGPGGALNPRELWGYVVLISGLSFFGYWLVKLYGARGVILTGVVGGIASSTATTLSIARLMRDGAAAAGVGAAGIVAANVVMVARVAAILFVVSRPVFLAIAPILAAASAAVALASAVLARRHSASAPGLELGNPLELKQALMFAALLAAITLAADFFVTRVGIAGFYVLAAAAGLADLDAVTLSSAAQSNAGALSALEAGRAILLAMVASMALKGGLTAAIAGLPRGAPVCAAFAAMAIVGGASLLLT